MRTKLFHIIFMLSLVSGFSQNDTHSFRGKIMEFEKPISGVHIYNLNSLHGTSSDMNGFFEIKVIENDTLIISHVKYRTLRVVVSKYYLDFKDPVKIFIDEMTNYLDIISIKNHNLSGSLNFDSKEVPQDSINESFLDLVSHPSFKDYEIDLSKPPSFTVDPTGGTGGSGVTIASINFPEGSKKSELRKKLYLKRSFPERIIADLGVNYFTKTLKIPDEKIHHYLTYCDYKDIINLYYKNEIMAVLNILKGESTAYLKSKD